MSVSWAAEERLREDVDGSIDGDGQSFSGTPRFNETQMIMHILTQVLVDGDDIDTFLSEYDTSITPELLAELVRVAKLPVELYAYNIGLE